MKILKAALGAGLIICFFVVLPRLMLEKVPPDLLIPFGPVQDILTVLTVLGLTIASLYSIKTLTPKANPANLVASVSLEFAGFYILLFFIGFGDPASLGRVEKAIPTGPGVTLVFDFRIFVLLLLAVLAFKVVVALLEFYNARSEPDVGEAKRGQNA
jgi:hypothetical protein